VRLTTEAVIGSAKDHIKRGLERQSRFLLQAQPQGLRGRGHGEKPRILFAKTTAASHTQKRREDLKNKHLHKEIVKRALRKGGKSPYIVSLALCLFLIIFLVCIQEKCVLEKTTIDFSKMISFLCEIAESLVMEMLSL
jgi:hypothetical protein